MKCLLATSCHRRCSLQDSWTARIFDASVNFMKMIHSSFSFDGSSVWDPTIIRKCLYIPEDQLNILSNIPGWCKASGRDNTLRLEKKTTISEGSLSSHPHAFVATQSLQRNNENIKSFDDLVIRGSIVKTHKLHSKKFRSASLSGMNKVNESLSHNRSLKRTLSLPILFQSSNNTYLDFDREIEFSEKESSKINAKKLLPVQKLSEQVLDQKVTTIPKSTNLTKATLEVMEVEEMPVNISNRLHSEVNRMITVFNTQATESSNKNEELENVSSSESKALQLTEKMSLIPVVQAPKNFNILNGQPLIDPSDLEKVVGNELPIKEAEKIVFYVEKKDNSENSINQSATILNDIGSVRDDIAVSKEHENNPVDSKSSKNKLSCITVEEKISAGDNSDIARDKMNFNSEKLIEICGTPLENLESVKSIPKEQAISIANGVSIDQKHSNNRGIDFESSEGKFGSCIVKETVSIDSSSSVNATNDKMDCEKLIEISETSTEDLNSFKPICKEQPMPIDNLLPNSNENFNLQNAKMEVCNQKISQENSAVFNEIAMENKAVAEKRKLDSNIKSSKRRKSNRQKPVAVEVRSIKRAGEIHYTDEDIVAMINIMKCFL